MSMLSEFVQELRDKAFMQTTDNVYKLLDEAADVIEELSEKLAASNIDRSDRYYNDGWILVSERLPDKEGNYIVHVKDGNDEDYVGMWLLQRGTYMNNSQTYIDDNQGYWANAWSGDPINEFLSKSVIAWMPLPEPRKEADYD